MSTTTHRQAACEGPSGSEEEGTSLATCEPSGMRPLGGRVRRKWRASFESDFILQSQQRGIAVLDGVLCLLIPGEHVEALLVRLLPQVGCLDARWGD